MTPAQVSAEIERLSKQALDDVLARIRRGETPRDAIEAALAAFRGPYYALIAQALSEILKASIGVARVKAWPMGRVTLSQRLYAYHRAISLAAASAIAAHMRGPHSARALAKTLYDGYNFKPDTLKVVAALPKYLRVEFDRAQAARLKTPALRAAYLEAIRKAEAGAGLEELGKRLNVALQERNRFFANRIARTELHRARIEQRALEWMGQEWVKTIRIRLSPRHPKADICDYHANADLYGLGPGIYPKAVAPLPPFHPFCLPGDAMITASGRITAVSKRWYDGDMAVITTAAGQKLPATVHHPVLTPGGWVAIGAMQVGDQVVCCVGGHGPAYGNNQHQNMPARIAEVADSFFGSSQVATREVPTSAEDFHGDGMAGQIAVIGADRQLWDWLDAMRNEKVEYGALKVAHKALPLFRDCALNLGLKASRLPTNCRMSSLGPSLPDFWRGLVALELLRLAHGAQRYPATPQMVRDRQATDARSLGNRQDGFSRLIFADHVLADFFADNPAFQSSQHPYLTMRSKLNARADQSFAEGFSAYADFRRDFLDGSAGKIFTDAVVNVDVFRFRGHVYNLETDQGHYVSNNIVTHNCFCLMSPRGARDPKLKPKFNPKAERAYLAGLPPEQAARVAGSRDRLQRALNGETLESLYNAGRDALYQWKRVGDVVPAAGMAVADAAQRYTEQLESLAFADALGVARRAVDDPLFRRFFEEGIAGHYPVGVLRPEDALAMGAGSRTVFLSDRSLREHLEKHPEIDLSDYRKIPTLLDQGEVWQIAGQPERLIYLRVDGVVYRAAIKRTRAGDENYFLTLFKNTKKKPPKGAVRLR